MAFKFVLMVAYCVATLSAGNGILLPSPFTYAKPIPLQYTIRPGQSLLSQYLSNNRNHHDQTVLYHTNSHGSTTVNKNIEYDSHPQYKYGYNIQDAISGDSKSQVETRNGDKVNGEYSLVDADGFKRIVQYTSDSINGFNAVVTRVPIQGVNNINSLVSLAKIAKLQSPTELPYGASAQEIDYEPVVKGAYAVSPIVRTVPVAYPISNESIKKQ